MRDFGKVMTAAAKFEIIDHMTTADLDQLADRILAKASNSLLDKALQLRIKTIEAVPLINALARAERLGYESSDVVEEKGPAASAAVAQPLPEHNMCGAASPQVMTPGAPGSAVATESTAAMHCGLCYRTFKFQSAYDHHVKGRVCTRSSKTPGGFQYSCQHCGQGFTTVMGLRYVSLESFNTL